MTRVEENNKAIEIILEGVESNDQIWAVLLTDISKSLAVIADAIRNMSEETKKEIISKTADEYFEKLINGEFGEGGPHATD